MTAPFDAAAWLQRFEAVDIRRADGLFVFRGRNARRS